MTTEVIFSSTIFSGLPVDVKAAIAPREPDVGILYEWVDEMTLYWQSGHTLSDKLHDRVTKAEWDRLNEEALEAYSHPEPGD